MGDKIYFASSAGRIKIGVSRDVVRRLRTIEVHLAEPLVLLGTIDGSTDLEQIIHDRLSVFRLRGEWFRDTPETRSVIESYLNRPQRDWIFVGRANPSLENAPRERRNNQIETLLKKARAKWPRHTAIHLAECAGSSRRAAAYWLAGRNDPNGPALARIQQELS